MWVLENFLGNFPILCHGHWNRPTTYSVTWCRWRKCCCVRLLSYMVVIATWLIENFVKVMLHNLSDLFIVLRLCYAKFSNGLSKMYQNCYEAKNSSNKLNICSLFRNKKILSDSSEIALTRFKLFKIFLLKHKKFMVIFDQFCPIFYK